VGTPQGPDAALPVEAMELLLSKMAKTKNNAEFLGSMANGGR
jgi:transcription termination factor Rho